MDCTPNHSFQCLKSLLKHKGVTCSEAPTHPRAMFLFLFLFLLDQRSSIPWGGCMLSGLPQTSFQSPASHRLQVASQHLHLPGGPHHAHRWPAGCARVLMVWSGSHHCPGAVAEPAGLAYSQWPPPGERWENRTRSLSPSEGWGQVTASKGIC